MDLRFFSHGYGQCAFHIVLVPKYRHCIFVGTEIKRCCEEALRDTARRRGCQVHALQVGPDHVHVFVGMRPDCSVSELVRLFKCNSARRLFQEYPELRSKLWNGHLWSRGKFYRSIGQVNAETIKRYIDQSKRQ
jgi:putative transposase